MRKQALSLILLATLALPGAAHAALIERLGGAAYYDDVLGITWLANANLADTNAFGVAGINANGSMNWATANAWIAGMNDAGHLGIFNWRLPSADVNGDDTIINCSGGGVVGCADNEMGYVFWEEGITAAAPSPFSNVQPPYYWSGSEYAPNPSVAVWLFRFDSGFQLASSKNIELFAWAVRDGDVAVPEPATAMLLGASLIGFAAARRRARRHSVMRVIQR